MPSAAGGDDSLKKYWWLIAVLVFMVGGWAALPLFTGGSYDGSVAVEGGLQASEQSLESLDAHENPGGAPGAPVLSMPGAGAYAKRSGDGSTQKSSLFEPAPEAAPGAQSSTDAAAPAGGKDGAESLVDALQKVAKGRRAGGGAGYDVAAGAGNAPFRSRRANFGGMSGLAAVTAGGGVSMAGLPSGGSASSFGSGASGGAASAAAADRGAGAFMLNRKKSATHAFAALQNADSALSKAAASVNVERAMGYGGQVFDASTGRSTLGSAGGQSGGGSAILGSTDGTPEDLKANDPKLQKRELPEPKLPEAKPVVDKKLEMEKLLTQMLLQAAIGGLLGPVFGGIGSSMAGGLGLAATPK